MSSILPYLPLLVLSVGAAALALMVIFAPADVREAVQGQYNDSLKTIISILGPTAVAALGDVAMNSRRPDFGPHEDPVWKLRYNLARWASWPVFGILAGMAAYIFDRDAPMIVTWGIAAVGGAGGTATINIIFNAVLRRYGITAKAGEP